MSNRKRIRPKDYDEAVAGILAGLADVEAGRSQPAKVAFAEIRDKRKIEGNTNKSASPRSTQVADENTELVHEEHEGHKEAE